MKNKCCETILKQEWARRQKQRKSPETVLSSMQHWGGTPSWWEFWLRLSTYKGKKKKKISFQIAASLAFFDLP